MAGFPTHRDEAFTSWSDEEGYMKAALQAAGIEPEAALAVAAHEGITLPSQIGDSGHAYGPWQMNDLVGIMPSSIKSQGPKYEQQWANSIAGIDYAVSVMAKDVGKGKTGYQAVHDIVWNFERPADKAGETARAYATYQQGGEPGHVSGHLPSPGYVAGQVVGTPVQAAGDVAKKGGSLLLDALTPNVEGALIRGGMIVGGIVLAAIGLSFLAKSLGLQLPLPGPMGAVANTALRKAPSSPVRPRAGDAAAERGEEVTRTGPVEPPDEKAMERHAAMHARRKEERVKAFHERHGTLPEGFGD